MSNTIKVMPNQGVLDVVIQGCGSIEAGMQFCKDNDISISDTPVVGSIYQVTNSSIVAAGGDGVNVLQYLNRNGYVVGTLAYIPPPIPVMQVVLMPVLKAVPDSATPPAILHHYMFSVEGDTGFITVYGLVSGVGGYPSEPNNVKYITTDVVGGIPATQAEVAPTDMTAEHISYVIPWTAGHTYMLVFGAARVPGSFVTFEDTNGNQATCLPLIILDKTTQNVKEFLVPALDVALVSSAPGNVTIRLTRSHYTPTLPGLSVNLMTWRDAAMAGGAGITALGPDPADPANQDKRVCTLATGTYTFGVQALYSYPDVLPESSMQCVVEVA